MNINNKKARSQKLLKVIILDVIIISKPGNLYNQGTCNWSLSVHVIQVTLYLNNKKH